MPLAQPFRTRIVQPIPQSGELIEEIRLRVRVVVADAPLAEGRPRKDDAVAVVSVKVAYVGLLVHPWKVFTYLK